MLKNLQTRQMWTGDKVNQAIEHVLTAVRSEIPVPGADDLVDRTLRTMRQDFKDSRAGNYRQSPKKVCGLFEHEYEIPLDDAVWKEMADRAGDCIRTFMSSEVFQSIREVPTTQWLELETLNTFDVGGVDVFVKLDFAYRDDEVVIYDWKTGQGSPDDAALQFACYALYAIEKWGVNADQIQTIEFNLSRNETKEHIVTDEVVAAVHDYILESIGEMQGLLENVDSNLAVEEDYPLTDDESVCRNCGYRKACPKWAHPGNALE